MKRFVLLALLAGLLVGCADVNIDVDGEKYEKYWKGSAATDDDRQVVLNPADQAHKRRIDRLNRQVLELYRKGKYAQAAEKLQAILDIDAKQPGVWYNLACVQALQGQDEKALDSLQHAVKAGYRDYKHMAGDDDLQSIRKTEQFRRLLTAARKQARRHAAHRRRGESQRVQLHRQMMKAFGDGKYDRARDLAEKVVQADPDNAVSWYNLACAESRLNHRDKALAALKRAIREGYLSFRHMEKDPDLANIRNTAEYRGILIRRDQMLRDRAEDVLSKLRKELGDDYLFDIDHDQKLVFATNIDRRMLDELKDYLSSYAQAQRSGLFTHDFEQYVTVILPRQWKHRGIGGLYNPARRTLTARSLGMVMTHEFTHALHFGDQEGLGQRHPIWVTEGLATLFESSRLVDGRVEPQPNYRLLLLQQRAKRKKLLDLEKLTEMSHRDFMKRAAVAYAQSRYLLFYLHQQGKLQAFYQTYTDGYDDDPSGAKALEEVLDSDLETIQESFRKWVIAQKAPPLRLRPNQAYIGIQMKQVKDGLEIVKTVPGSGAAQAGLQPGDVVVKVSGERVVDSADLLSIVAASDVGDRLRLEIRRDGKYRTVEVTLTAMPKRIP
jgi:Tfp pilus assembly protein PilF